MANERAFIIDTGPLVALIDRGDKFHSWITTELAGVNPPLSTCEAVISETLFLLRKTQGGADAVLALIERDLIHISFQLKLEVTAISKLLRKYQNVPMALADACLVRMAELNAKSALFTLDSDFRVYRKNGRQMISVIMPI